MEERAQMPMVDDEIDLVELFRKIWKHKWLIVMIIFLSTFFATAAVHLMQPKFKASATVIPNNKEFLKLYIQDLRALRTASEMKFVTGDINLGQYTTSIYPFFLSTQVAIDAFGAVDTFDSSKYRSIEEQIANEYKINTKQKDGGIHIDVTHPSPEITVKFSNMLIQEVNKKLNENFSPGQNVQYLIVTDPPRLPQKPDWPKKKLIIAVSALSSIFIGIFLALFIEWISEVKKRFSK